MQKFDFTDEEIRVIQSKTHFTDLQKRIIEYRRDEWSITKMALTEKWSESKINKEIAKINKKIMKVI